MADRNAEHDEAITDEFALPGVPDAFDRLWTPHRMAYVAKGQSQVTDEASCPFCTAPQRDDETSLIVARGETCYVVMNLYPYNQATCWCVHTAMCQITRISTSKRLLNSPS